MTEIKPHPLPEWGESERAVKAGKGTALQRFIYENEPGVNFEDNWRDELQTALTEAIEADRRARQDEAEKLSRAKHYGNGHQDGWNSALDAAIDLIDMQFDGAENTAVLLARGAAGRIRALKRGKS